MFRCVLILFTLMSAKDVAMFVINVLYGCILETDGGKSKYVNFDLSTWMYVASITHFLVIVFLGMHVMGISRDAYDCLKGFPTVLESICKGIGIFGYIFLFTWMVIGFLFQKEIRENGVNNQECGDILLAWLILQMLVEIGPCFFGFCTAWADSVDPDEFERDLAKRGAMGIEVY